MCSVPPLEPKWTLAMQISLWMPLNKDHYTIINWNHFVMWFFKWNGEDSLRGFNQFINSIQNNIKFVIEHLATHISFFGFTCTNYQ